MTDNDYLRELRLAAADLPDSDQKEIMDKYRLYYEVGALDGLDEAEVTAKLPTPYEAVRIHLDANSPRPYLTEDPVHIRRRGLFGTLVVGAVLLFVSIFTVLIPSAVALGVAGGIGFAGIYILGYGMSLMHTAFLPILPAFFSISGELAAHPIASGIFGIGLGALGLFFILAAVRILLLAFRLISRNVRWNGRTLRGGH